jgi:hypothetical protein
MKKNQLNLLEFLRNRSVWFGFGFLSLKPKKQNQTKLKPKKPSQTRKIQVKPEKTEPNQN